MSASRQKRAAYSAQDKKRAIAIPQQLLLLKQSEDLGLIGSRIRRLGKKLIESTMRLKRRLSFAPAIRKRSTNPILPPVFVT